MTILKIITRLLAFVAKEFIEVVRRPGALISLVFGPFIIMLLFGAAYSGSRPAFRAAIVVPPGSGLDAVVQTMTAAAPPDIQIVQVLPSEQQARQLLESGAADVVVIAPDKPLQTFQAGQQSIIRLEYDSVDPVRAQWANEAAAAVASSVNQEIIREAVQQEQRLAAAAGHTEFSSVPADVVAAPTRADTIDVAPTQPRVLSFFGPAVAALVLQHMALTLVALALVRERTSAQMERYRIAPVSTTEVILGKVAAYGIMVALIAALTIGLLVRGLSVPLIGGLPSVAGVIVLLIFASTAIGLLIGVISDSERQAVQLSLLALLATVFFGGLLAPVQQLSQPVGTLALAIPVTHAAALLQNIMLNGGSITLLPALGLMAIAGVALLISWLLLRRSMAPA
jgi:ABC-2 type transport system permease protein